MEAMAKMTTGPRCNSPDHRQRKQLAKRLIETIVMKARG
ncbi:hypothetical protein F750_7043 [Streptomyces sp. PAMC 26508]|nr:hypothetical protein F750_7043 [Streptomyces sp. PAMC 26508]